jgi:hypothetical protein
VIRLLKQAGVWDATKFTAAFASKDSSGFNLEVEVNRVFLVAGADGS